MEQDNVKQVEKNLKIMLENGMKNLEHLEDLISEMKDPRIIRAWSEVAATVSTIGEKILKLEQQKIVLRMKNETEEKDSDGNLNLTTADLIKLIEKEQRKN